MKKKCKKKSDYKKKCKNQTIKKCKNQTYVSVNIFINFL